MNSARALLSLQETDQQLASRRHAYKQVCAQLDAKGGLNALKEELEKARTATLETRVHLGKLEVEAAALKERVAEIESRLYSGTITNLRELTAVESEHSAARRQLAQADEALGPARTAVEDARRRHEYLSGELEKREAEWQAAESKLIARRDMLRRECEEVGQQRESAAGGIDAAHLALYDSLLVRKGGSAVARVERGVCQACHVRLPLREISRMRSTTSLVSCGSCGRILLAD